MPAFTHHLFVCCNQRSPGHPRGCCDPDASHALRNALAVEIKKHNLGPHVRANIAGCLEQCEHGPVVIIYPQQIYYGNVQLHDVPRIIEQTVLQGKILDDLVIADECINNRECSHAIARRQANQSAANASTPS